MPKVYILGENSQPIAKVGFPLDELEVTIGRSDENHIAITHDATVSSSHARISRVLGGFVIEDLQSTHGVTKNGQKVNRASLRQGTTIKVGTAEISFTLDDEETIKLSKEPDKPSFKITPEHLAELNGLHNGSVQELSFREALIQEVTQASNDHGPKSVPLAQARPVEPAPQPAAAPLPAAAPTAAPAPVAAPSMARPAAAQSAAPPVSRPRTYAPVKKSNPMAGFLVTIIFAALGLGGGLWFKHYQLYDGANILTDIQEEKILFGKTVDASELEN